MLYLKVRLLDLFIYTQYYVLYYTSLSSFLNMSLWLGRWAITKNPTSATLNTFLIFLTHSFPSTRDKAQSTSTITNNYNKQKV